MYCVYQNQGQGPISLGVASIDRFYNFPLMKHFCRTFLKNYMGHNAEIWFTVVESGLMYRVYRNQGQGPITRGIKSLDRFYVAMLPCATVMLSGKHKFKIF